MNRGDVVALGKRVALVWRVSDSGLTLMPIVPLAAKPGPKDVAIPTASVAIRCALFVWPDSRSVEHAGRVSDGVIARVEMALAVLSAAA